MKTSTVEFVEGFRVVAEAEGIRIEVTDYHAKTLFLPYTVIDDLKSGHGKKAE